jgi:D-glycero-D-manno-heptose 1,7-bisphosphate phosphatase
MQRKSVHPVLLDRDGVINYDSAAYVKSPEEFVPIPGSVEAIGRLTAAGFTVIVVTNQANVGRGVLRWETLGAIHAKLATLLDHYGGRVERFYICPHRPEDHCACRKPKPGLLLQAAAEYRFPLTDVWYIGDSRKDLEAARDAGAQPILVRTGNGEQTIQQGHLPVQTLAFDNLAAAADMLIREGLNKPC